jgi:hypothetical protein
VPRPLFQLTDFLPTGKHKAIEFFALKDGMNEWRELFAPDVWPSHQRTIEVLTRLYPQITDSNRASASAAFNRAIRVAALFFDSERQLGIAQLYLTRGGKMEDVAWWAIVACMAEQERIEEAIRLMDKVQAQIDEKSPVKKPVHNFSGLRMRCCAALNDVDGIKAVLSNPHRHGSGVGKMLSSALVDAGRHGSLDTARFLMETAIALRIRMDTDLFFSGVIVPMVNFGYPTFVDEVLADPQKVSHFLKNKATYIAKCVVCKLVYLGHFDEAEEYARKKAPELDALRAEMDLSEDAEALDTDVGLFDETNAPVTSRMKPSEALWQTVIRFLGANSETDRAERIAKEHFGGRVYPVSVAQPLFRAFKRNQQFDRVLDIYYNHIIKSEVNDPPFIEGLFFSLFGHNQKDMAFKFLARMRDEFNFVPTFSMVAQLQVDAGKYDEFEMNMRRYTRSEDFLGRTLTLYMQAMFNQGKMEQVRRIAHRALNRPFEYVTAVRMWLMSMASPAEVVVSLNKLNDVGCAVDCRFRFAIADRMINMKAYAVAAEVVNAAAVDPTRRTLPLNVTAFTVLASTAKSIDVPVQAALTEWASKYATWSRVLMPNEIIAEWDVLMKNVVEKLKMLAASQKATESS